MAFARNRTVLWRDAIIEGYQDAIAGWTVTFDDDLRCLVKKGEEVSDRKGKSKLLLTERALRDIAEVET